MGILKSRFKRGVNYLYIPAAIEALLYHGAERRAAADTLRTMQQVAGV